MVTPAGTCRQRMKRAWWVGWERWSIVPAAARENARRTLRTVAAVVSHAPQRIAVHGGRPSLAEARVRQNCRANSVKIRSNLIIKAYMFCSCPVSNKAL